MRREVQQILERDRQAVQRTARDAGVTLQIGGLRQRARFVAVDIDERMQTSIELGDPREKRIDDFAR